MSEIHHFLDRLKRHAFKPLVVKRAVVMALVVGAILVAINQGDRICEGTFSTTCLVKSFLTMLVPYSVSTVSSVLAMDDVHSQAHG